MHPRATLVGFGQWAHLDKVQRAVLVEQVLPEESEVVGAIGYDLCLALTIAGVKVVMANDIFPKHVLTLCGPSHLTRTHN